ncbi:MAG TPA: hypothetical protein PKL85_07745, partial [Bacteroidia bacterium]|nr:hypothetical protein [Bacteroidia bacterium]
MENGTEVQKTRQSKNKILAGINYRPVNYSLRYFFRITVYYIILFAFWRLIFLVGNSAHRDSFSVTESLLSFVHGARMDLSVIGYLLAFPVVMSIFPFALKKLRAIMQVYHVVVALLLTLICLGNVMLFHFWGSLINYRALTYLSDPKEIFVSLSTTQLIVLILILVLLGWIQLIFLRKWLLPRENETINISRRGKISAVLIAAPLIVLCIRGGWQMLPMNESLVYFSKNPFLNQ